MLTRAEAAQWCTGEGQRGIRPAVARNYKEGHRNDNGRESDSAQGVHHGQGCRSTEVQGGGENSGAGAHDGYTAE